MAATEKQKLNCSYEELRSSDTKMELIKAKQEAELEEERGYPEIAACWRQTAEAINVALENPPVLGKIYNIKTIPPIFEAKENFSATQTSMRYLADSLKAIAVGDFSRAQQLAGAAKRITTATTKFEYWRKRAYEEAVAAHLFDEKETTELVKLYRGRQAGASFRCQQKMAQQWAEAACLARSATLKIKKMNQLVAQKENSRRISALLMAAYWTKEAAFARASVATALEQRNKKKLQHALRVACAVEKAAMYRSKAARMIKQTNSMISHYWTMAAYWVVNNVALQDSSLPHWKKISRLTKQLSRAYVHAANNERASRLWRSLLLSFWLWRIARTERRFFFPSYCFDHQ